MELDLHNFDWQEVFEYASIKKTPVAVVGDTEVSTNPFTIKDIKKIFGWADGQNDGDNWIVIGQLKDKRFFFISAGCDFTGWG